MRCLQICLPALVLAACGGSQGDGPDSPTAGGVPETLGRVPVVLVVFDALNSEHVGHLGYERDTTPRLDAFAEEAVSFRTAFSPAPYTLAGIASLITGKLPDRHGIVTKKVRLRDDERTLAEILSGAGYPTYAVVANPNGGAAFGAMDGFDEFVPLYLASEDRPNNYVDPSSGKELHMPRAEELAPLLGGFLDGLEDPAAPFFFYGHVLEPHSPYVAPDPWREMFLDPAYDGPLRSGDDAKLIASINGRYEPTEADIRATVDLYDGNLAYGDHGFGLMMDELKQRGLYEDSLIIVVADHGEAMFQHGSWGHNETLYDEMVQVPFLVRFPGQADDGRPRGQIREELTSIMDVVPSVCQWLDLAPPEALDGRSIAGLLAGTEDAADFEDRFLHLRSHSTPPWLGLRERDTKIMLVRGMDRSTGEPHEKRTAFFDLGVDPGENDDIGESGDPRVEAARAKLIAEIKAQRESFLGAEEADYSAEEAAMMGALGYTDEDE